MAKTSNMSTNWVVVNIADKIDFRTLPSKSGGTWDKASFHAWIDRNYWDPTAKAEVVRRIWVRFNTKFEHDARYLNQYFNTGDQINMEVEFSAPFEPDTSDPARAGQFVSWGPKPYERQQNGQPTGQWAASFDYDILNIITRGRDGKQTAELKATGQYAQGNQATPGGTPNVTVDVPF